MFTKQVELLNGLRGLTPEEALPRLIDNLQSILGECSAALEHRGQVAIEVDGLTANVPPITATSTDYAGAADPYYGLQVINPSSLYDLSETVPIENGVAADFEGVVRISKSRAQNNPDNDEIALAMGNSGGLFNSVYVSNIYSVAGTLAMTISGSTVTIVTLAVTNNATVGGTMNVVGNFSVNSTMFTVAAATGNTVIAGTLTVNSVTFASLIARIAALEAIIAALTFTHVTEVQTSGTNFQRQVQTVTAGVPGSVGSMTTWPTGGAGAAC